MPSDAFPPDDPAPDQPVWPTGIGLVRLGEVDSTMKEAARLAREIDRPTWIIAEHQTGAKGRMGRPWKDLPGNLAATLVMRPACTPPEAALRSFLAANALFETLALHIDRECLGLKWPNDVLLNGGKVAGILLESAGAGPFVDWLAIGVGVNLHAAPPDGPDHAFRPVALFDQGGDDIAPETFLAELASSYATQEAILAEFGFAKIREGWLRHAARLGEVITATTPRAAITGRFETIDEAGNLILDTGTGREVITAADVHFGA